MEYSMKNMNNKFEIFCGRGDGTGFGTGFGDAYGDGFGFGGFGIGCDDIKEDCFNPSYYLSRSIFTPIIKDDCFRPGYYLLRAISIYVMEINLYKNYMPCKRPEYSYEDSIGSSSSGSGFGDTFGL